MKEIIYILLLIPYLIKGQSYVLDSSFEDKNGCPPAYGLANLNLWYTPNFASSDYMCDCFPSDSFSVGSRSPIDSTCMIGLVLHQPASGANDPREYAEIKLKETLVSDERYCISFYTMLSPKSNYAVSNIHVGFRQDSGYVSTAGIISVDTFLTFTTTPIIDTVNWTKLEIEYVASGFENFVTIGNFDSVQDMIVYDYNSITSPPYLYNISYYFFDLITLEKCIDPEKPPEDHFTIYPNPSNGSTLYIDKYADTTAQITLYNALGQQVGVRNLPAGAYQGAVFEQLASGVYVVVYVTASGYREEKKVVVF